MATSLKKKEFVDVSNETLEENEKKVAKESAPEAQEGNDTDAIEVSEEATHVTKTPSGQRMVKVKLRSDHKCHVADTNYVFEAGKQYTVPEAVKFILNRADLLAPL